MRKLVYILCLVLTVAWIASLFTCTFEVVPPKEVLKFEQLLDNEPVLIEAACFDTVIIYQARGANHTFDSTYYGYIYNTGTSVASHVWYDEEMIMSPYEALYNRLVEDGYIEDIPDEWCEATIENNELLSISGFIGFINSIPTGYHIMIQSKHPITQGLMIQQYPN